jgi:tetratricopeptide (TPR) repeat protein
MPRRRKSRAKKSAAVSNAPVPIPAVPRRWWPVLVLVAVSLAVYANALRNGFVADDDLQILRNPFVTESHSLPEYFATGAWGFAGAHLSNYYRPLQLIVYASEYTLYGDRAWAWHLVNVCVNAGAVVAAYFLLLSLADWALAFWVCLLFALHPMHVEAVVWVAALPDLICGLLLFLAMLAYHYGRSRGGERAWWLYFLSALAFFGALLTKETALLFPLVILSYEYFYLRRPLRELWQVWASLLPFAAALAIYFMLRWRALGAFTPSAAPYLRLNPSQLALAAPVVLARYVGKLFAPLHFNFFYFTPPTVTPSWESVGAILLLAALVVLPFVMREKQPLLAFGVAWFLLTLAPALDINAVGENYLTERYLYIPSFGFAICAGWVWLWVLRKSRGVPYRGVAGCGVLSLVLIFCVVQIERRIPVFRDDLHLYQATVLVSPNSARLQAGLALAYQEAGNLSGSIEHDSLAVAIDPNYEAAQANLGDALVESNRSGEAIEHLKIALALQPDDVVILRSLAKAYVAQRQWSEAAETYRSAAQMDTAHADYYQHFVDNLERAEQIEREIPSLRERADRDQNSVAEWDELGRAYATVLDWDNALACFRHVLGIEPAPGDPAVLAEVGIAAQQKGDFDQAISADQQVLASQPQNTEARVELASALYSAGRIDESIAQLQEAIRRDPTWTHADDIYVALGLDYEKKSDWSDAGAQYQRALQLNPQQAQAQQRLDAVRSHLSGH